MSPDHAHWKAVTKNTAVPDPDICTLRPQPPSKGPSSRPPLAWAVTASPSSLPSGFLLPSSSSPRLLSQAPFAAHPGGSPGRSAPNNGWSPEHPGNCFPLLVNNRFRTGTHLRQDGGPSWASHPTDVLVFQAAAVGVGVLQN